MQTEENLVESIKKQRAYQYSYLTGLASTPSESFTKEWWRIIGFASEFWDRCERVYTEDEQYLYRRLNTSALEWLKPVLEDVAWMRVVRPNRRYLKQERLIDFRYKFVGKNLRTHNGRKFQGDQILDRVRIVTSSFGSGGLQSHLFTLLSEAAATGECKFLCTQYINCNNEVCDIHFAPLPVANESDQITDFFCPMLIRPAQEH